MVSLPLFRGTRRKGVVTRRDTRVGRARIRWIGRREISRLRGWRGGRIGSSPLSASCWQSLSLALPFSLLVKRNTRYFARVDARGSKGRTTTCPIAMLMKRLPVNWTQFRHQLAELSPWRFVRFILSSPHSSLLDSLVYIPPLLHLRGTLITINWG